MNQFINKVIKDNHLEEQLNTIMAGYMQNVTKQLSTSLSQAFTFNPDIFKQAIKMNRDSTDMTELMKSMMNTEQTSYDNNLKKFGYCDFDNPRYFFYNFISNMYDEIYAYEGKVMLSRNESDIKCLFRLEFKDNCELLSKAEELENINKLCKKVLIEFPVDKGIYKLRIYTINSKN